MIFVVVVQDYLLGHLSELLSHHVYQDSCGVLGEAIIELGRAETFAIRRSRNQAGAVCSLNETVKAITKLRSRKNSQTGHVKIHLTPPPNNDNYTHAHTSTHTHTIFHTLTLTLSYLLCMD